MPGKDFSSGCAVLQQIGSGLMPAQRRWQSTAVIGLVNATLGLFLTAEVKQIQLSTAVSAEYNGDNLNFH
jgi:hypothetical protein